MPAVAEGRFQVQTTLSGACGTTRSLSTAVRLAVTGYQLRQDVEEYMRQAEG